MLDIHRDLGGGRRRPRIGIGEAEEAEHLRVTLAPELGVVAFPAAQVLGDRCFGSDGRGKCGDWVVD